MKNGRVKAIGSELIDVKLKFGADVLRKLVKGNFMWLKGLDWRVIHGAGNSDAQQLDQPGEQDEGRGAAPPIFSKGKMRAVDLIEGAHPGSAKEYEEKGGLPRRN